MYNDDTELLFPSRVIPALRDQRGASWRKLVDRVAKKPEDELEHLAFVLLMIRVDGCTNCNADSFRAMRGCTECAKQNVRRYRGGDKELLAKYDKALKDVEKKLAK